MSNEFDDVMPNSQTPRKINRIGSSERPWHIIHSESGNFQTLILSNTIVSGIISYDQAMFKGSLEPADISFTIEHNLNTECVDVIVIDDIGEIVNPNSIKILNNNIVLINFIEPQLGKVLVQKGK